MSKAAEKKKDEAKYARKFCTEWELNLEFKGWLCVSHKSKHFAFCKYCKCDIQARLVTIRLHSKSTKHTSLMSSMLGSSKVNIKR